MNMAQEKFDERWYAPYKTFKREDGLWVHLCADDDGYEIAYVTNDNDEIIEEYQTGECVCAICLNGR
jgi:hypothetical protein